MKNYQKRLITYFEKQMIPYAYVEGQLWREYQRMIVSAGPVSENYEISPQGQKELFNIFPASILCRTTIPSETSDFYAVVCSSFTSLEELSSKRRSEMNRGLNNCKVRLINPLPIADELYDVYSKAVESYNQKKVNKNAFIKEFTFHEDFDDIINFWGIFHEEKLIGYSKIMLYDKTEANITVAKFNPDYLKLYPSYALFHTLNSHYIDSNGFSFVNDGFCSLLHDTNIQNFLMDKFGYKKYPVDLYIHFRKPYGLIFKMIMPFKKNFVKPNKRLEALFKLIDASKKYK
ncbi:MAG: hypothetical protein PHT69_11400 [Bacteroidales bacterium]|nr:hypothetical protein [Bacteroidales bacterium]